MNARSAALLACLAALGCNPLPFREYEVPALPEEPVLSALGRLASALERGTPGLLDALYADDVRGEAPEPSRWTAAAAGGAPEIRTWAGPPRAEPRAAVLAAWRRYLESFRTIARAELKPRSVEVAEAGADAVFLLGVMGQDADGRFRNDRFRLRFALRREEAAWRVTGQQILEGECVLGTRSRFRDVARENGTDYLHRAADPGVPDGRLHQVINADAGTAAADYDGDGWTDLFYCDGLRNALFRNRGDGRFEDVTARAGLEGPPLLTRSAVFFDADNDGDLDLFIVCERAPCRLFRNRGDGTFEPAAASGLEYSGFPTSVAVADYDRDGLLDVALGVYGDSFNEFPGLEASNGHPNVLYRNLGGLRFADVTKEAGVGDRGWTFSLAWGDVDADGDPDLFVCNDWSRSTLYLNDGGRFTDVTTSRGMGGAAFGMSAAFGDYDNDGDLDMMAAGMYSNAGRWLFKKRELLPVPWFLSGMRTRILGTLDGMTSGNRLFRNEGGAFADVARPAGVDYGQFAWGTVWIDADNDGFLDLYGCNGFWTGSDPEDT